MLSRLTPQHALRLQAPSTTFPRRMSSSFQEAAPPRFANWRIQSSSTMCGRPTHSRGRGLCVHRLPVARRSRPPPRSPRDDSLGIPWIPRPAGSEVRRRTLGRGWPISDGCRRVRRHRHGPTPCQQVGERRNVPTGATRDRIRPPALPSVGSTGPRLTATCFDQESKASHMRRSAITQTCSPGFSASGEQMPGRGGSRQ